jgi:hypothetical protein
MTAFREHAIRSHPLRFIPLAPTYWDLSRKNFRPTVIGIVMETWPALVTAGCATGDQAAGKRFVVDCKVNSATLAGHVRITFVPEGNIASSGGGNEMLNTAP